MTDTAPKRIDNPIPPEYANVFVLKTITVAVGIICLILTAYATWVVYTMSNRIAAYESPVEAAAVVRKVAPIDFGVFERVITIDEEKQNFTSLPLTVDVFYNRLVTSTAPRILDLPSTQSSSTLPTPSSTPL